MTMKKTRAKKKTRTNPRKPPKKQPESQPPKCDGGRTCPCGKPSSDFPDHPWTISDAGLQKYIVQSHVVQLRCPDNFGKHTFSDHFGYGIVEVVQNLVLDFVEAGEENWKERWAVCGGTVLFLLSDFVDPMLEMDDFDGLKALYSLIGRMFLTMLANLETRSLLSPTSEVKNLGQIMALYIQLAAEAYEDSEGIFGDGKADLSVGENYKSKYFDAAVRAYAQKHIIKLSGPDNIDDLVANVDEVDLPAAAEDPWNWDTAFKKYVKMHGGVRNPMARGGPKIGGDSYDITTWTSAERRAKNFQKSDPLGKRERDAIAGGMVMKLG